ncbi:DUF523 domain-containing protein [Desulforhopalus singaporensis]|uniref:Uncharacterized conserved protein YbbK, DUF523 family n=1 Tax=Desulforhopalus singaporensis TaxID=91360 RepID=A0A1H0M6Q4_9BACT|nr:DUF523 domain-containing protein [Desulforhopalus singaporensis]SDO75780.1 Uncharacterized conserved protein YbbK, DUF523 family [Desulforhopalus singaporensis]
MQIQHPVILVSACLVGLCTRYDAKLKPSRHCLAMLNKTSWIPVCPEQLGGLPTPREAANIRGGDGDAVLNGIATVITKNGTDLTQEFIKGAKEIEKIVNLLHVEKAYLKAGSPSCAVADPIGVTAALLRRRGVELVEF